MVGETTNQKTMQILRTERLTLSHLGYDDAEFIIELLNDSAFLRFIGDKGVRTTMDARDYLRTGPLESYENHGFGLFRTALTESGAPIGICGLLHRDYLEDPDIGFAMLQQHRGRGYAREAAAAVLAWGRQSLGLTRIVAIVDPNNTGSVALLEKLGFAHQHNFRLNGEDQDVSLFAIDYG